MFRIICLAFGCLAVAFYALSGGPAFDPEATRDAVVAARTDAAVARAAPPATSTETVLPALPLQLTPFEQVAALPVPVPAPVPDLVSEAATREPPAPAPARAPESAAAQPPVRAPAASTAPSATAYFPSLTPAQPSNWDIVRGEEILYVSGDQVNLRNGPGTIYGVVTQLARGTAVRALERTGAGWVRLRTVDGQNTGWIADFLLRGG